MLYWSIKLLKLLGTVYSEGGGFKIIQKLRVPKLKHFV